MVVVVVVVVVVHYLLLIDIEHGYFCHLSSVTWSSVIGFLVTNPSAVRYPLSTVHCPPHPPNQTKPD